MTLLIDKSCVHCRNVESAAETYLEIKKLYVINNMIQFDGIEYPLDKKIPALPALIVGDESNCRVYCGEKHILDFLKTLGQENI